MNIKIRLTILNFLQFFMWGAWLISFGGYMMKVLNFSGTQVGSIYATMGIASIFMPALVGIIADKWINAEKLYSLLHFLGAIMLFLAAQLKDFTAVYAVMFINSMVYMPTIALNNTISYSILERNNYNIVKVFPNIRVFGTIGFIIAMWIVDLMNWPLTPNQLYFSSISALILSIYALTLPACPPENKSTGKGLVSALGLDAFKLFKSYKMAVFFVFAMLLGAALQITNTFGEPFLHDFHKNYPNSFAVKNPGILLSLSQISETLFILTIPFFLRRFGIKKVMLMSMFAWFFRFGFFGIGNPAEGFIFLVLSMIVYGMAFDFFNISGSLFVELETEPQYRASAQGLFMLMTNGLGATIGATLAGMVVDYFTVAGIPNWPKIWFSFAAYALVVGITFMFVFRYKHDPSKLEKIHH